ncbi:hypothetical protein GGR54DRAFT_601736 [Hypoxylon sp. NC1633]|nr:hypothetical protein GGR54DRAFT_601736 [Hypoxylon sp. NC1633]
MRADTHKQAPGPAVTKKEQIFDTIRNIIGTPPRTDDSDAVVGTSFKATEVFKLRVRDTGSFTMLPSGHSQVLVSLKYLSPEIIFLGNYC